MLVLSRGQSDRVVFPTLGISLEILRINGNKVRLGIDAPQTIPVFRAELTERGDFRSPESPPNSDIDRHAMRNRLHKATLGLHLLQCQLDAGLSQDAEPTFFGILNDLRSIENELQPASDGRPRESDSAKPHRALIVDDDANESELLAGYLRLSGFEVDTAMDGLQAMVRLSKDERPNVVLLDMKMPRFDGGKTVNAIRHNPQYQGLKIFAVTGSDPGECCVQIGPQGVDRWFSKPIDPRRLVEAMQCDLAGASALAGSLPT